VLDDQRYIWNIITACSHRNRRGDLDTNVPAAAAEASGGGTLEAIPDGYNFTKNPL
jgi:hypothetical protein